MISASIKDPTTAVMLGPIMIMPLLLVGGFYGNQGTMPIYIEIFSYISPFQYTFNNFAKLQFENSEYPSARQFAEFLDIKRDYWDGIGFVAIEIVVCQLLALLCLKLLVDKFQ